MQKIFIIVPIIVVIIILVVVIVILKDKKENYKTCVCSSDQGGREKQCQDNVVVNNLYVTGELTEFSNLPNKGWGTTSPGDTDFPLAEGCYHCDKGEKVNEWKSWDFDTLYD